jgi:hypothetical protein
VANSPYLLTVFGSLRFVRADRVRDRAMGEDDLRHIVVGDPDPTPNSPSKVHEHPDCRCGFEWTDEASQNLTLLWSCTREPGHPGQHLAGTGEWVAAVHPETQHYVASKASGKSNAEQR